MHELCGILTWKNSPSNEQKMQKLGFIYMKHNFVFVQLGSSCICLPFGPWSIVLELELCTPLLALSIFFVPAKG